MTTGTNGDDDLHNDPNQNPETINALGGDDSITIDTPLPVDIGPYRVSVDGGTGFDTLNFSTAGTLRPGSTNTSFTARESSSQNAEISYVNVERLVITGRWSGDQPWTFGGATEDWLALTGTTGGKMGLNMGDGDDRVTLTGLTAGGNINLGSGNDRVDLSGSSPTSLPFFVIRGGTGNDELTGSSIGDSIYGDADNDVLNGGGGNDVLDGGAGGDSMAGGVGNDRYYVEAGDSVTELDGEGVDIVFARTNFVLTGGAYVDLLAAVDASSSLAIQLTGNELGNSIQGNAGGNRLLGEGGNDNLRGLDGNDTLDGGAGIDSLNGGNGGDRYYVDQGDVVVEASNGGLDIVFARTDYVLTAGAHVELLAAVSAAATDAIDLTGNELNNSVQGNAGANVLLGGGGVDNLKGLGGEDSLDGGGGADVLYGGAGADTFRFTAVSDTAYGSPDSIADFVSGTDRIDLSAIDANSNSVGDDGFTFIGTNAFTGSAGQLRYETVGSQIHLLGDVNGDGVADLRILLNGPTIAASDFIV